MTITIKDDKIYAGNIEDMKSFMAQLSNKRMTCYPKTFAPIARYEYNSEQWESPVMVDQSTLDDYDYTTPIATKLRPDQLINEDHAIKIS